MSELIVMIPEPKAPCQECVENPQHADEDFGLVWCSHTRYGGIYDVELGQWQIVGPFRDEAHFKRALYNNLALQMQRKSVQH